MVDTCLMGKNVNILMDETKCPGIKILHLELEEEEFGHMSCRIDENLHYIYVLRGNMICQVNQGRVELRSGDGLFVNCDTMFRLAEGKSARCEMMLVSIDVKPLWNEVLMEKYVRTVTENVNFPYLKLENRTEEQRNILKMLHGIWVAANNKSICCELEIQGVVYQMWAALFREYENLQPLLRNAVRRESDKLKRMLVYLHKKYKEKITLGEIAEDLGVSSGDYCRFFKKHMRQTPFEYLQAYRIERSIPELLQKEDSIIELSLRHGFNGSSYYAETFRKEMGCTPGDYRKWYLGDGNMPCPLKKAGTEEKAANRQESGLTQTMPAHLL